MHKTNADRKEYEDASDQTQTSLNLEIDYVWLSMKCPK